MSSTPSDADSDARRASASRAMRVILGLLLAAGAAILIGTNQTWHTVTVERAAPLPPLGISASGSALVPLGVGIGVLLLASVVAVAATRTLGRRLVAVVLLAGAIWLGVTVTGTLGGDLDQAAIDAGTQVDAAGLQPAGLLGPGLVYAGCLLAIVGAAMLWVWSARLPRMGEKYERSGPAAPRNEQQEQRDQWRALDRGEDPTA